MFQEKWQKFYTLMQSNDIDSFGIDFQETLNNSITQHDFTRVLKMDCGSGYNKYLKIYINKKWQFQSISHRMASPIRYVVKIIDQLSSEVYDFSNPNENRHVLNKWLSYFINCCKNDGIIIKHKQMNNNMSDLTIKHGLLDLSKRHLGDLSILKDVTNPLECKKLMLDGTKISVIENLDRFENLEFLNLGNNNITKINGLQDLKKLKELLLHTNQIEIIENLDSLKNLERLILDYNQIKEIRGLDNLKNLKVLSMNINYITTISNLESLYSLENLNLDENPIQDISSIGNLDNLKILRIHNNDLPSNLLNALSMNRTDQTAPIEKMKAYARSEYVIINDEYIFTYKSIKIEIGYEILELNLGHRDIHDITSIKNLTNIKGLKSLILWNNHITEIKVLEDLRELEFLYLNKNEITSIKGLNSLKNLKVLEINDNYITKIENLHSLLQLKRLELNNNKIKEINGLEILGGLVSLDLSGNEISEICNFDNLEQLTQLFLQSNQIKIIKNLNSLKNLKELNLSVNQIKKIEGLESLIHLRRLFLSKNKIQEIEGLENNIHLIELDLKSNMISNFCGIKQLQYLHKLNLEKNDSIAELIKKINKISSNEKNFAKNCVGYCLLKEILKKMDTTQKYIIKFEDLNGSNQFLLRFKYPEIKSITKLLTNQNLEYQVGGNDFVISIFNPRYFADELAQLLEKIEPGENYKYEHLKNELNLRNIEILKKLTKYIEENDPDIKIPFTRKLKSIVRRKKESDKLIMETKVKELDYDFLFICPIEEEFDILIQLCPIKSTDDIDGFPYYILTLPNKDYKVLAILLGEAGLTKAAQITERFLNTFSISAVFLIGIAGGIDPDLELGDLVIPNEIIDYLLDSKAIPKGKTSYKLQPSINTWNINPILIECVRHFRYQHTDILEKWQKDLNDYRKEIKADLINNNLINKPPNYKIGHLASGNIVSGSEVFKEELKSRDRKYLAIEMEAAGVARAVFNRSKPPLTLIIRGISDFSDSNKSKIDESNEGLYRKYAIYSVIKFLLALLESKCIQKFFKATKTDKKVYVIEETQGKRVAELLKKVNNDSIKISEILPEILDLLIPLQKDVDISWIKAEISGNVEKFISNDPELYSYRKIFGLISKSAINHQGFSSLIDFRNKYKEYFIEHSISIVEPLKELEKYKDYKDQQIMYYTEGEAYFYTEILQIKKVLSNIRHKISELLVNQI